MDESAIPPLLGIVGHPIAGNPMQFAMEQALAAADLDWRFLSFDVPPERLEDAVHGVDALGFRGLAVAAPHGAAVYRCVAEHSAAAKSARWVDVLARSPAGTLVAHNLVGQSLCSLLEPDRLRGATVGVLGDTDKCLALAMTLRICGVAEMWFRDAPPPVTSDTEPAPPTAPGSTTPAEQSDRDGIQRSERGADSLHGVENSATSENGSSAPRDRDSTAPGGTDSAMAGDAAAEIPSESADQPLVTRRVPLRSAGELGSLDVLMRGSKREGGAAAEFTERQIDLLKPSCIVVDLAVCASTSPLLRFSAARGLPALSAIDLLVTRAALAFRLWTGRDADQARLREAFEEYLEI